MKALRLLAAATAIGIAAPAFAQDAILTAPPGGTYQRVSDLVPLPAFLPGLGELWVDPATLPAGPFLSYDHAGQLVATIFMIPIAGLEAGNVFDNLSAPGGPVDHIDIYFNVGHAGVEEPHAHVVLWRVPVADEARVAE